MPRFFGPNGEQCDGRQRQRPGRSPQRLDARRSAGAPCAALRRPDASRAVRASPPLRPERRAGLDAPLDQDRRLSRGLRLLPAERPLRHRPRARGAHGNRRRDRARPRRARRRRDALLHGRRVAEPEGPRPREGRRDGRGRREPRPRDLRDARHADAAAGRAPEGRGTRLLQPQPRHVGVVLRRGDHDAHVPGPPRHARGRARRRHQRLLRRHPRHGRAAGGPRRVPAHARDARPAPGERADQQPRAGRRHAARRHAARSTRSSSCASSRSRAS